MSTEPAERPAGALRLLRTNSGFRALWSARSLSYGGDAMSLVALMLFVAETTGQALTISLLLLVVDFLPALLGPLTGVLGDRYDRRRVMITCEVIQGGLVIVIALTLPPLPVLLVLVGLRAVVGQVFQPASRAVVPALVRDRDLETANSAIGFGTNGGEAAGPLLAAALFPVLGVRGVLLVDAASFLLAAVLLRAVRAGPAGDPAARPAPGLLLREAAGGLRYLAGAPVVRAVVFGFAGVVACTAIDDVALVVLARDTLAAGDSAAAILLAAVGIGLLAGYAVLARTGHAFGLTGLLLAGFAVSSLGNLLTGLVWAVAAAFAVQAVRGLGIAAMDIAANTMLQRQVPAGMQARVFGNLYGALGAAAAFSYVAGGLLLDATSARATLVLAGAGGSAVTLLAGLALRRAARSPH